MVVWCMLIISISEGGETVQAETALKGRVIKKEDPLYFVDFSEYALEKGYLGKWDKPVEVNKDNCVGE